MTAIHDRLIQTLKLNCPGAQEQVIRLELLNAVTEACRSGQIWAEDVDFSLAPNTSEIEITPAGTDIVEVLFVARPDRSFIVGFFIEGTALVSPDDFNNERKTTANLTASLILAPRMDVSLDTPETWIPEDLWHTHFKMFLDGTLCKLSIQPSKPYTNSAKGQLHGRMFRDAYANAASARRRKKVFGAQVWRFPRF